MVTSGDAGRDIEGDFGDVLHIDAAGVYPLFGLLLIQPAVQVCRQSAVIQAFVDDFGHGCLDMRRVDDGHADFLLHSFQEDILAEAHHPVLGGAVGAMPRPRSQPRGGGPHIDDPPAALLFFHDPERFPAAEEHPGEVRADGLVPFLEGHLSDGRGQRIAAGAVHQDIQLPPALDRIVEEGDHLLFLRHVRAPGRADSVPALDVRRHLPQTFFIHVDDHHLAGVGGVDLCDRLADSRSASGDDGDLAFQPLSLVFQFPSPYP